MTVVQKSDIVFEIVNASRNGTSFYSNDKLGEMIYNYLANTKFNEDESVKSVLTEMLSTAKSLDSSVNIATYKSLVNSLDYYCTYNFKTKPVLWTKNLKKKKITVTTSNQPFIKSPIDQLVGMILQLSESDRNELFLKVLVTP